MKKYRLGKVFFEWVYENEMGNAFRTDDKSLPLMTFYEHQLIKLGAIPIDEPEENEEFAVFDDPYLPEKGSILGKLIRNQEKLIKAVKQLQEER